MPKSTVVKEDPNISVYELMTNTSATYSKNTVLEGESALKLRGLANYGYDVVEFRPGLRLVDNKGKEVKIFWATDEEIQNMEGGTFSSRRVPIPTIYSDIPNGTYQIEVVYKVAGEETFRKMPIMPRYGKNMVTISDDKVNFSTTENTPRLELTWKTPVLRKDSYNYVDFEIKNVGNEGLWSRLVRQEDDYGTSVKYAVFRLCSVIATRSWRDAGLPRTAPDIPRRDRC